MVLVLNTKIPLQTSRSNISTNMTLTHTESYYNKAVYLTIPKLLTHYNKKTLQKNTQQFKQ